MTIGDISNDQKQIDYKTKIFIGTGEMICSNIGPSTIQVVGPGVTIAQRLSDAKIRSDSYIQMSQYTLQLLDDTKDIKQIGKISRPGLYDLFVYGFQPERV